MRSKVRAKVRVCGCPAICHSSVDHTLAGPPLVDGCVFLFASPLNASKWLTADGCEHRDGAHTGGSAGSDQHGAATRHPQRPAQLAVVGAGRLRGDAHGGGGGVQHHRRARALLAPSPGSNPALLHPRFTIVLYAFTSRPLVERLWAGVCTSISATSLVSSLLASVRACDVIRKGRYEHAQNQDAAAYPRCELN